MKAIQMQEFGAPNVLKYVDLERPEPGPGQVLVKVDAISVNAGDIVIQRGGIPGLPPLPIPLPLVPGTECSGTVERIGEDVTGLNPDQSVVAFIRGFDVINTYAEYVVIDAKLVVPVPENLDKDVAAVLPTVYLTAYHLLHTMAKAQAGQTILLYAAAGGVGTAFIQLAKLIGVNVIGMTSSAEKAQFVSDQGADHVINYKTEDVAQRVMEITSDRGVDFIINSVAGDTFARDIGVLAPFGQLIWTAFAGGPPQANLTELLAMNFMKNISVGTFSIYGVDSDTIDKTFAILLEYAAEGKITPHIHDRIPLSEASRAHELFENAAVKGKLVLKP
jgi:NADPH2:quinone reductase